MTDTNTSASGGYLQPTTQGPVEDLELDIVLQGAVRGITGIDGKLVRPRWQREPGGLQPRDVNWAAIGSVRQRGDTYASEVHDGSGDGQAILTRQESIDVLASFYGPACRAYASKFRDGLFIAQNRASLQDNAIELVAVGDLTRAPELLKGEWYDRCDVPFEVRRAVTRNYAVLNILSADGSVTTDTIETTFHT